MDIAVRVLDLVKLLESGAKLRERKKLMRILLDKGIIAKGTIEYYEVLEELCK